MARSPARRSGTRGAAPSRRTADWSAESSRASRSFRTALFNPTSKSTNVSAVHSNWRSSSRVTNSPGRIRSARRIWKDCSGRRILRPCRRSSPDWASSSNTPKRNTCASGVRDFMAPFRARGAQCIPSLRQIPIRRGSKRLFRSHLASDIENSRQPLSRRRGPGHRAVRALDQRMFGFMKRLQE